MTSYTIGGHRIAVPQRLDPEHRPDQAPAPPPKRANTGHTRAGVEPFRELITATPEPYSTTLAMMADWVEDLVATLPGVKAETSVGAWNASVRPLLRRDNAGLVTLWRSEGGKPSASLWRTVFQRRAPDFIEPVERLTKQPMGQGTVTEAVTAELLAVLGDAYRVAAQT